MTHNRYHYPFSQFMQQCELNYSLLCRLVKDWSISECQEIRLDDESLITIQVEESHKYTSFLKLKHVFSDDRQTVLDFELKIRLYHDAQQAEVFTEDGRAIEAKLGYPNRLMQQTDEKSNLNHFLGDLLQHCFLRGRLAAEVI